MWLWGRQAASHVEYQKNKAVQVQTQPNCRQLWSWAVAKVRMFVSFQDFSFFIPWPLLWHTACRACFRTGAHSWAGISPCRQAEPFCRWEVSAFALPIKSGSPVVCAQFAITAQRWHSPCFSRAELLSSGLGQSCQPVSSNICSALQPSRTSPSPFPLWLFMAVSFLCTHLWNDKVWGLFSQRNEGFYLPPVSWAAGRVTKPSVCFYGTRHGGLLQC